MLTPVYLDRLEPLHVSSFTPASNLVEDLPQGVNADILLLGYGDARHILYTPYAERGFPKRKYDITTCEINEHLIARDVLLLTLIIDNAVSSTQLWNVYYHFYLSDPDIQVVHEQAKKLVKLSQSLKHWLTGPYGSTLRFGDEKTLSLVHEVWLKYVDAARDTNMQSYKAQFESSLKLARSKHNPLQKSKKAVSQSCAPFTTQIGQHLVEATEQHWQTGLSGPLPAGGTDNMIPNPVFAVPLKGPTILEYPTDPLLSFHLAAVQANLTELSPLQPEKETLSTGDMNLRLFEMAMLQFGEWIGAFRDAVARTTIRFIAADCFALCYTLRQAQIHDNCANWYRAQLGFDVLELDYDEYSLHGNAPKQFNVIDTSNLSERKGTMNFLVAAGPLLKDGPASTIYTRGMQESQQSQLEELICKHTTTVSILLGLVPINAWTNATAVSRVDEILTALSDEPSKTLQDTEPKFSFRLLWKQSKHVSGRSLKPVATAEDIANLGRKFHCKIFQRVHSGISPSPEAMATLVPKKGWRTQYHMGSVAAVLKAICNRAHLNCNLVGSKFVDLHTKGSYHDDEGYMNELVVQIGDESLEVLRLQTQTPTQTSLQPAFMKWETIPSVVAVTVVVPSEKWKSIVDAANRDALEETSGIIGGHVTCGKTLPRFRNLYHDVQIAFGKIIPQGSSDQESFAVSIQEDKEAWRGSSTMLISFYVPTSTIQAVYELGEVGFCLAPTKIHVDGIEEATGFLPYGFSVPISNRSHVFFTKYKPGQHDKQFGESGWYKPLKDPNNPDAGDMGSSTPPSSESSFTALFSPVTGDITALTRRIDIKSGRAKELLTDERAPVKLEQTSPLAVNIVLGKNKDLILDLRYPAPVTIKDHKTRIARTSGYIEVTAQLASAPYSPILDSYLFPTVMPQTKTTETKKLNPVTLNLPHLNLDTLPILSLTDKRHIRFLTTLTSLMFSPRERQIRNLLLAQGTATNSSSSTPARPPTPDDALEGRLRADFKESLFTIFMVASGLQGGQTGLFALSHPERGGIHALLFVSAIRLDAAHGSVVLDAAVLPFTKELVQSGELEGFLLVLRTLECCTLTVGDEELELWKKTLPAWAERCRTWMHVGGGGHGEGDEEEDEEMEVEVEVNKLEGPKTKCCEYITTGRVPLSVADGEQLLCSCGMGRLPDNFINLPDWDVAAKYATRVAISPVFAEGLVEPLVDGEMRESLAVAGQDDDLSACRNCGKKEGGRDGVKLKRCMRCLEVVYCSGACQKADWSKHRMECKESEVYSKE